MQERLILRLPASMQEPKIHWFIVNTEVNETIASGELESLDDLNQLAAQAERCFVTVAIPGQDAVLQHVTLPSGARRHLDKVIPFALEEELASDIEKLHFAWSKPGKSSQPLPVVVTERRHMQQWQAVLNKAQIRADEWIPDYLLLPYAEGEWHCLTLGNDTIVRVGHWQGFTLENDLFGEVLSASAVERETPKKLVHYGELGWLEPTVTTEAADIELPVTALALGTDGFDIRQREFRPATRRKTLNLNWRPLAVAAACCFVVAVSYNWVRAVSLNNQADAMQQQALALYKQQFPEQQRVVNLRVQLQRQIDQLGLNQGQQASMLRTLDQLGAAFSSAPSLTLELLKFQRGELRLHAIAQSFGELEKFQQSAKDSGLVVEQGTLSNRGSQVAGTITVSLEERS
ncbi:MAG: type II secretion system protein GspL [Pseudomonadota bacterium]